MRFSPKHGASTNRWGIYWQELMSGTYADGTEMLSPDVADVDDETLAYWIERSSQTKHPVLRARYADLSWDIGRYLRGKAKREGAATVRSIPITMCHVAIDAYLETISRDLFQSEPKAWIYLGRAIELAIGIGDKTRMPLVKDVLFAFYRRQEAEEDRWMWWKFDELVWDHAKALAITPEEKLEAIDLLEGVLARCSDSANTKQFDPHSATSAADCLGRWRAQLDELAEARSAMKTAALAFEEAAKKAGGMTAIAWLEDLIPRYRRAGMLEDAARVEQAIRDRAGEAQAEMKSVETSIDISPEEMEKWLSQFLSGTVDEALTKVAGIFLIREESTKSSLRNMCKDAPLLSMMQSSIVNIDGFTTATVGSIEADIDGRAIQHAATLFSWKASWLNYAFDRIQKKYGMNPEVVIARIRGGPFFAPEGMPLLAEGVTAWFAGDAAKAIHLIVPRIEAALRSLLAALGGTVMEPNSDVGGFMAIGLGKVLNNPIFREKVPKDICFHLRALYNDPRGLNLRNELAHGLVRPELLNVGLANWVIHTVLLLGLLSITRTRS